MKNVTNTREGPSSTEPTPARRFTHFRHLIHDTRRRQRLLFVLSLIAFGIVAALAAGVRLYPFLPFDVAATREIQEHQNRVIDAVMYGISAFGFTPWVVFTLVGGVVGSGALLGWQTGAYLLVITVLEGLANAAIKLAIGRPRPISSLVDVLVPEHGNSFPSGHVMFYTVFFGFLALLAWTHIPQKGVRWAAMLFTLGLVALIGPSRMFLGAHWLSDVIAAYLLGFINLAFAVEFYLRFVTSERAARM